jgi:excisionase family DNA binding protein
MSIASCGLGHDALQRALYSPREVQQILGISRATVYRLLAARRIDGRKLGGKTVITAESIGRLIAALPAAQVRR